MKFKQTATGILTVACLTAAAMLLPQVGGSGYEGKGGHGAAGVDGDQRGGRVALLSLSALARIPKRLAPNHRT